MSWDMERDSSKPGLLGALLSHVMSDYDAVEETVKYLHPMILAAKANSEDTPNWNQAMNGPDCEGYWEAMIKEYNTLEQLMECWEIVDREDWMNVLPSTWAFQCKRYPDGSVRKLKARFCARGDRQIEGIDFFETYAPVVNWQTVRIMLVLSIILGLATKQVDYTAAFIHAKIDRDPNWESLSDDKKRQSGVYIEMPCGFMQPSKVLKLKRSLYGLKQAPCNFYLHLKSKLEEVGFTQSEHDQCLFISDRVICLIYVDDTLFFAPKQEYIDAVLDKLQQSMTLNVENDVAGFLGVHIQRHDNGTIELTQKGLIERCIAALDVESLPVKKTPAEYGCLGSDKNGDPAQGTYSYASVVGMLQYLVSHSRPDLTFAVSQCARYTHCPC
jgi:Reverse transcriptase (RNA-dependent DNA polymerase)